VRQKLQQFIECNYESNFTISPWTLTNLTKLLDVVFTSHGMWVELCVKIQKLMSVLWITEAVVHSLSVPTHLETTTVPVLKDILAMESIAQVNYVIKRCHLSFVQHNSLGHGIRYNFTQYFITAILPNL